MDFQFKSISDMPEFAKNLVEQLNKGNSRFISGERKPHNFAEQREASIKGQKPDIIILTCSDSRVVPHYIFDEKIGELFIIRKAGNIIGTTALGSIEFAAENLGAGLFLTLGHNSCGAVRAALQGDRSSAFINSIINSIMPAVMTVRTINAEESQIPDLVTYENVKHQMKTAFTQSRILKRLIEAGKLAMVGGIYRLDTGVVRFIDEAIYE
jgi:carbonic anhydrase